MSSYYSFYTETRKIHIICKILNNLVKLAIKKAPFIGLPTSFIKMERETRLTVSVCEQEKVTKCHVFRRVKNHSSNSSRANRGSDEKSKLFFVASSASSFINWQ